MPQELRLSEALVGRGDACHACTWEPPGGKKLLWGAWLRLQHREWGALWGRGSDGPLATCWESLSNASLRPSHSRGVASRGFIFTPFLVAISVGGRHRLCLRTIYALRMQAAPVMFMLGKGPRGHFWKLQFDQSGIKNPGLASNKQHFTNEIK